MDRQNLMALHKLAPDPESRDKVRLLRSFDPAFQPGDDEVPDPYFGGPAGFDRVFDICDAACHGLLDHLRRTHGLR